MSILEKKIQKMLVSDLEAIISNEKTLNELFGIPAANFEQTWEKITNSEPPTTPMNLKPIVGAPTNDPSPDFQVESLKMENLYQLMLKHPAGIARRLGPEGMVIMLEYIVSRFVPDAPDFDDETVTLEKAKNLEVRDVKDIEKIGEFVEQVAKNPEEMLKLAMKVMGREFPPAEDSDEQPGEAEQALDPADARDPKSLKNQDKGNINKALNQLRNKGISDKDMVKQFDDAIERIVKNAGPLGRDVKEKDLPVINKFKDEIVRILKGDFSNLVKESKNNSIHNMAQLTVEKVFKIVSNHSNMDMFDIKNDSDRPLDGLMKVLNVFLPWAQKELGFDRAVKIRLISDKDNEKDPMGFTGHYNPGTNTVTTYIDGRHPKDILRSISHELVHHNQNCNGKLAQMQYTGPGYAQKDKVGKECEDEAYLIGNGRLVRTFGDTIWKKPIMENKTMNKVEEKKKFPDLTGDGKVTQADVLKGRGVDLDDEESDEKDEQNEGKGEKCKECGRPKGTDEGHCPGPNESHCPGKRDDLEEELEESQEDYEYYTQQDSNFATGNPEQRRQKAAAAKAKAAKDKMKKDESLEESNDPVKKHADLKRHVNERKEKDLFNKLMEKWCK